MKKFFLKAIPFGVAFLFGTAVNAQVTSEIRDFYVGNVVTNDTFTFWVAQGDAHQYLFSQYNISANTVTYRVQKTNVTLVSGASTNFCVYHNNDPGDPQSQCYIPSVMVSGNFITYPGEFNTLLADFSAGSNAGTSMVNYKFFNINNAADSVCITLVYNVTPVGIAESVGVSLGEAYPNPSNGVVNVHYVTPAQNANLIVTDALGKIIYNAAVANGTGEIRIETLNWAKGIYTISLCDENGIAARRKIVVQ